MSSPPPAGRESFRAATGVQALIGASVAIYYLQLIGLSGPLDRFAFSAEGIEARWWTIGTFMFVHGGFWHLAANMYALFLFGPRIEQAWGTKRFVRLYLLCAVAAPLAHAALVRDGGALTGSSAAVFGVMIAYAVTWPEEEVFLAGVIPIRVWTAVGTLMALNLGAGIYLSDAPDLRFAYLLHLAGAAAGWAFMRTPGAPTLDQLRQRVARVPDAEEPPRPIPRSQPRVRERDETDEIVQRSRAVLASQSTGPRVSGERGAAPPREDLNRVLDKISAFGIESLTEAERRTLEDMARRLRDS